MKDPTWIINSQLRWIQDLDNVYHEWHKNYDLTKTTWAKSSWACKHGVVNISRHSNKGPTNTIACDPITSTHDPTSRFRRWQNNLNKNKSQNDTSLNSTKEAIEIGLKIKLEARSLVCLSHLWPTMYME
jgi:hypothetical protein